MNGEEEKNTTIIVVGESGGNKNKVICHTLQRCRNRVLLPDVDL